MVRLSYIAVFGLIGVFSRYFIGVEFGKLVTSSFPYATFIINMTGSFLIGVVYVLGLEHANIGPDLRVGLMVGLLGGYTTFSSFSLETIRLFEEAHYAQAALYGVLSPVLGWACALAGLMIMRLLLGPAAGLS